MASKSSALPRQSRCTSRSTTLANRPPDATYLAWLDCTALDLADPAGWFLEHARVAVNDGPPFGVGAEQCVRLNFGTSRVLLDEIVGRMGAARR